MSTFKQLNYQDPKIVIDNEDNSYNIFIKLLMKSQLLSQGINFHQLKCSMAPPKVTIGNRIKRTETDYNLYDGEYTLKYNGNQFKLSL